MTSALLHTQAKKQLQPRPDIRPGFTVLVHERIQEGNKERVQVFEGLVISVHKGHTASDSTFTVRRIVGGIGVEKVFSIHSPKIEKVEVKKVAKVRRSKLFFLRGRRGKAARLSERFTTADEFAVAVPEPVEEVIGEAQVEGAEETEVVEETEVSKISDETEVTEETEAEKIEKKPEEKTDDEAPKEEASAEIEEGKGEEKKD